MLLFCAVNDNSAASLLSLNRCEVCVNFDWTSTGGTAPDNMPVRWYRGEWITPFVFLLTDRNNGIICRGRYCLASHITVCIMLFYVAVFPDGMLFYCLRPKSGNWALPPCFTHVFPPSSMACNWSFESTEDLLVAAANFGQHASFFAVFRCFDNNAGGHHAMSYSPLSSTVTTKKIMEDKLARWQSRRAIQVILQNL